MDSVELRGTFSSPAPDDIRELQNVANGLGPVPVDDDENLMAIANAINEQFQIEPGTSEADMSKDELALKRWLSFINSPKVKAILDQGSKEFIQIRDQLLEEMEWERQGLVNGRKSDEELKRLRLQLAAQRGWQAIRAHLQKKIDDKQHQQAQNNWRNMFKIAKEAASVKDPTLLDLYERYGFLGWDRQVLPPHNPMIPEKHIRIAQERALILKQMAREADEQMDYQEAIANKRSALKQAGRKSVGSQPSTSEVNKKTTNHKSTRRSGPFSLPTTPWQSIQSLNDEFDLMSSSRAVTLLSIAPTSNNGFGNQTYDFDTLNSRSATKTVRIASSTETFTR